MREQNKSLDCNFVKINVFSKAGAKSINSNTVISSTTYISVGL